MEKTGDTMIMQPFERKNSVSELQADPTGYVHDPQQELVGRFSDLSMASFNHTNITARRRCSAKYSYDSDNSNSDMSMRSVITNKSSARRSIFRRFSYNSEMQNSGGGALLGLNLKSRRRMSEMSLGEYSNATDHDDSRTPPSAIYTIREDSENENLERSVGDDLPAPFKTSYGMHSFDSGSVKMEPRLQGEFHAFPNHLPKQSKVKEEGGFVHYPPEFNDEFTSALNEPKYNNTSNHAKFNHLKSEYNTADIVDEKVPYNDAKASFHKPQQYNDKNVFTGESFGTGASGSRQYYSTGRKVGGFNHSASTKSGFNHCDNLSEFTTADKNNRFAKVNRFAQGQLNMEDETNTIHETDEENTPAPDFIVSELVDFNGKGPYEPLEQLIILVYGYQFFYSKNVYAIISKKMQNKRNRASIRQKLEQIVHKASGTQYGSLLHRRDEVLPILRREFWKILYRCEQGSMDDRVFARNMKKLAQSINMPEQAL